MKFFITTFEQNHPILALFPIVIPRIILENLLGTLVVEELAILGSIYYIPDVFYKYFSDYLNVYPVNSFYSAIKFIVYIPYNLIRASLESATLLVGLSVLALLNAVTSILYLPIKQTIHNLSVDQREAVSLNFLNGVVLQPVMQQTAQHLLPNLRGLPADDSVKAEIQKFLGRN